MHRSMRGNRVPSYRVYDYCSKCSVKVREVLSSYFDGLARIDKITTVHNVCANCHGQ